MVVQTLKLNVGGMTCNNCTRTVERKLSSTPGVSKASVDLAAALASVEYDAEIVEPEILANAVRQLGFEVLS